MRAGGAAGLVAGAVALLAAAAPVGAGGNARAAAPTYGPRVQVMVAGRTRVLRSPTWIIARQAAVPVGRRRCTVAAGTPLAALEALRRVRGPTFSVRDYGSCSTRPLDSSGLFVFRVGADYNRGRDGWVYKVGRRAGTAGAADLRGPFGNGRRLASGQRLLWFYCRMALGGSCQPTLEVSAPSRVAAGSPVAVGVRAYDDAGRGRPVAGAMVRLGFSQAVTGGDGTATLPAPAPGRHQASASAPGAVAAFPVAVSVG